MQGKQNSFKKSKDNSHLDYKMADERDVGIAFLPAVLDV